MLEELIFSGKTMTRDILYPTTSIFFMVASVLLSLCLSKAYMYFHSGVGYSHQFTIGLVITSLTITLIMIIIGSNIARAFALVGAMSIVRFRNPIKDTMDLIYIFSAIAIGMAVGTGFLYLAIAYLVVFVGYLFFVKFSGFGERSKSLSVIRIFGSFDVDQVAVILDENDVGWSIISTEIDDKKNKSMVIQVSQDRTNEDKLLIGLKAKFSNASVNQLNGKLGWF